MLAMYYMYSKSFFILPSYLSDLNIASAQQSISVYVEVDSCIKKPISDKIPNEVANIGNIYIYLLQTEMTPGNFYT